MKVSSVQTHEVMAAILRSPEKNNDRIDAGKGVSPEPSGPVLPGSTSSAGSTQSLLIQAQALVTHINYTEEQLNKILMEFPPFFPAGSYQRVDLIKAIRGIQDQVEKSSVESSIKQEIASRKLSEDATDGDISVALNQLINLKDELVKGLPVAVVTPQQGALVSIKV